RAPSQLCQRAVRRVAVRDANCESSGLHAAGCSSPDRSRRHRGGGLAGEPPGPHQLGARAKGRLCATVRLRKPIGLRRGMLSRSHILCLLLVPFVAVAAARAQQGVVAGGNDIIQRGEYLARAGDCIACHTAPEGRTFAGGRAMPTPFGTIYSSNITPDRDTGIGKWSADDFYSTMHRGRFPDGGLIYPAMPFASYTKVTRADSDAIFAYLKSIPAVNQKNREHDLSFPYNNRQLILGWRTLFFSEGEYKPDPSKSAEWNRGAYLVDGLGHCGMCHSPINMLGGTSQADVFKGGLIPMQNWYAPSLTSDREAGLGEWSIEDITDLLQAGVSKRGVVYGPMAEVVHNSLQYLNDEDIRAMAVYLKSISERSPPPPSTSA